MSAGEFLSVILIALSLSADCFAVAVGGSIALNKIRYIQVFRTALSFGAAQTMMPVIGWLIGRSVVDFIEAYDHWVAFGLLAIIGGRMIWEAFHEKEEQKEGADISRGLLLLILTVATSIDSLAAGLSFAFLDISIISASLIIGLVAFLITHIGFYVGRKAGSLLGKRAKIFGGIILVGIGVRVVVTHILV